MNRLQQAVLAVALIAAGSFAAYRVIATTAADHWAETAPTRALRWAPDHPVALQALAQRQLAAGQRDQAATTARQLLSVEPLQATGFRVLAQAAQQSGATPRALALYRIAVERNPRDIASRAWLTEHYLGAGDFRAALAQLDVILRMEPKQEATLLPILAQLARDPAFAIELARRLQARPPWRGPLLTILQRDGDVQASQRLMSALHRAGGLNDAEFDHWTNQLIGLGRWGEAYGHWASTVAASGLPLSPVYNGGFERPPSGRGFDWRLSRVPGAKLEFVTDTGATGQVAYARFRNRPVPQLNIEQALLLAPGRYRFSAKMRADALSSDRGLEWVVACAGAGAPVIVIGDRIEGTFGWRALGAQFTVPATGCEGQWLRLRNPAPAAGAAQYVTGELWLDDVAIVPVAGATTPD